MNRDESEAILMKVGEGNSLSVWWHDLPEGTKYNGIELVEKTSTYWTDSYDQGQAGRASMVFYIGGAYYKLSMYHSSYDTIYWDYPDKYYGIDVELVRPRIKRVSGYE